MLKIYLSKRHKINTIKLYIICRASQMMLIALSLNVRLQVLCSSLFAPAVVFYLRINSKR